MDAPPPTPPQGPPVPRPLSGQRLAFVRAFALAGETFDNLRQSAIAAGYAEKGADAQGQRLLRNAQVRAEIDRLRAEAAERARLSADRVLEEVDTLAVSDVGALFDLTGEALVMLPMRDWPEAARRAVAAVDVKVYPEKDPDVTAKDLERLRTIADAGELDRSDCTFLEKLAERLEGVAFHRYQIRKVKLWDKNKALDMAGRHRKLFTDKTELSGPNGEPLAAPLLYLPDNGRDRGREAEGAPGATAPAP